MRSLIAAMMSVLLTAAPVLAEEDGEGWSRWAKSSVRRMVTGSTDGADERFGLRTDRNWSSAPNDRRRVVLVHGFNASPESMAPLAQMLRRQGHPCALACYPNDQAIDRSAKRLGRELRGAIKQAPGASVAVVTHSMGGLVARRVLEDPRLDPGGVDRLVMIAPPNHGSSLARIAAGTDLYEHAWQTENEDAKRRRKTGFYHSFDDGMGEATHDLRPGSRFLTRLNARPRNPRVAYTIILGDRGRFSDEQLERVRSGLAAVSTDGRTGWLSPTVKGVLDECDELLTGHGDGAVALKRGRLAGVDDVHVLPGGHDMIHLRGEVGEQIVALINERL